jgi:MOSC domain-containing protein YiiM
MGTSISYPAVREWHRRSGSFAYYVKDQVAKAEHDGAPQDAIYKRDHHGGDDQWVTVRDLAADHEFRQWYETTHGSAVHD